MKWWRKGKIIEEVREFSYLGCRIKYNGKQDGQLRERIRKGAAAIGQVWGIGKRRLEGIGERGVGCLTDWCGR